MRQYACPRCFVVAPCITEVDVSDGLADLGRHWVCDECLGELRGEHARDLTLIVSTTGRTRGERPQLRPRAVGE